MPDVPSSPRKAVSSVSQQARSQKKPGAPKPKGAVRAKSGCYTCRIRRKKCDEQPNEEGACQTCVRLRLQCLGFGAKRPDWMRENNSVTELRDKIKTFLASQGMIKGHSGSGPRTTEQDPQVLVLVDHLHTSPSSPPTPTLSATSSEGQQRPPHNGMNTSFERAPAPHYPTMQPPPPDQQHYGQRPHRDGAAYHSTAVSSISTAMIPSISTPAYLPSDQSAAVGFYNHPHSSLGLSYNTSFADEDVDQPSLSPDGGHIPTVVNGYGLSASTYQDHLLRHYFHNVLPIQYLLADSSITNFMANLIHSSQSAREAACMLSALHLTTMSRADQSAVHSIYQHIQDTMLVERPYNEGDAMAGLHIVSSFLFSGGRGNWEVWLGIASQYVQNILNDPRFYGPEEALRQCAESTRFIIKTTMWFDVLASVTTQQVPRFLETYRALFAGAYIGDALAGGGAAPETSMLPVMGCENGVVLAIAEISNLAHWKALMLRRGRLSYPELVHRGQAIEERYLALNTPANPAGGGDVAQRRRLTNSIFRASAKVYLHTVLSGDYPACPEIMGAVGETIDALREVPEAPSVHRSVVRSVVFGICICGCLTDDQRQRTFLLHMLERQQQESVGNIAEVMRLMKNVWDRRDEERRQGRATPVDWREIMREGSAGLLLLV
ncbi:fungal-specific transcription factor domain-containing protein [Epithele typhae]|uniref:fungal-specific transcription factor domain-containing protein n=1 Tax=Epithele typhae TaxID=378194 RepID=UPI002008ACEE|nr:fungal-specific transcription factor domain-containing protein [Epithele typhae]KAH9945024.1 fungal-specific transcription factor domain-containing protein [Epithele typhae]